MTKPILKTKLYVPQLRSKAVTRTRLLKRLSEDVGCKLTLICAPAGFGKTTLVSEWVTGCNYPVAWLSLEEEDNDLIQFISYFIVALQSIGLEVGEGVLDEIHSLHTVGVDAILTTLINEIAEIAMNFVFVIDDYHVIDNKAVNDALIFLLDHMPTQMRFVVITRNDQYLPLARLRSKNQLKEIRAMDLRFTHLEVTDFFNQVMSLSLSDKDIVTLETRTEGWIAGLQLVAISILGQKDITGFIESFSGNHNFIMDYLVEEVLNQQSEEIHSFLLHTSILDCFCGSLCDAIMLNCSATSQKILEYLQHINLFIVPLDNERVWYRYHHLFADLLRQKLSKEFHLSKNNKDKNVADLHIRASKWFENNDLTSEAIHHALAARDFERAASLIEVTWSKMDKSLQSATWLRWAKMIPDELVRLRPVLSVGYAWALLDAGEIEGCEQRLQSAENCIEKISNNGMRNENSILDIVITDEEQYNMLPSIIATARAYLASVLGDIKASIKYALKAQNQIPKGDHYNKEVVNTLLGLAQWANGELEAAYNTITKDIVNTKMDIMVAVVLAPIRIEQGKLNQALRIYEKSLHSALEEDKIYQIPIASFYLGIGNIKLLKGDLIGAEEFLKRSMEKGENAALPNWRYNWYLLKARIMENQGKLDESLDLLNEAESYYYRNPIPNIVPLGALKTRVFIKQGKIYEALDWVKENHLTIEDELSYLREFEHITLVRVLIAKFSYFNNKKLLGDAKLLIERLLVEVREGNRIGHIIELHILKAFVYELSGDLELALESLKVAIKLAEPEEFFLVFINDGMQLHRLLLESDIYIISPDYVSKLLTEIEKIRDTNESRLASSKSYSKIIVPLSKRELEILKLIADGLSNHDISDRLFLALSTIKNYNQNLFGKLQVKSRTEAIKRARELGLL
ncbi:helix-turn-helix transcriptional regulator [Mycoplasmatota bacterium]|nr:helix-turn-helix transcriptional regulator [Mycoplasmatota bacterium]